MLAAAGLTVDLGGRTVLRGIDLALGPGGLTVIVGPNGAGKSTLLKALTGLLRPGRGSVTLDGRALADWPQWRLARRRAVLAQSLSLGFPFTVFEMVALGCRAGGVAASREAVALCLAAVDLADYGGRLVQELSGGEQQRVHIARVLAQLGGPRPAGEPAWLFLDEPTAGLDVAHQLGVLDLARAHARGGGGTVAILHDLNLASLYADRLVVIAQGAVRADGAPAAVLTEPLVHAVFGDRLRLVEAAGRRYVLPG